MIKQHILIFYIYTFLSYTFLFSPIWVLFLLEHNFTMIQVGLIDSIYWLALFIFQIPAGLLSDRYPRTYIMALSSLFVGMAIIVFAFPVSFWVVVFSYVLWAGGVALKNVGDAAWLFDYMHLSGKEQEFTRVYGIGMGISYVAVGIAAFEGGFLGNLFSLQFPILLSGLIILFSALFPFMLPCSHITVKKEDFLSQLKDSLKIVRKKHLLYLLLMIGGIYSAFDAVMIILKQPFLYSAGFSVNQMGIIYLVFTFVGALASVSMFKVEKILRRRTIAIFSVLPIFSILILLFTQGILAVSGLLIISFTTGLMMPLMIYYINLEVPSDKRGVMLSYLSVIYTAILIPLAPFCGYLADISITIAILSMMVLCIPLAVLGVIASIFGPLTHK
ncbi:MAG: MFS transporter [Thermoplasmata archaeon]